MNEIGVIYSAVGDFYVALARRSIRSLKQYCDVPVTLFTCHNEASIDLSEFSNVKEINLYDLYSDVILSSGDYADHIISRRLKIQSSLVCDYEKFLYIDSDTLIQSSIMDFFKFDVAGTFFLTQQPMLEYVFHPGSMRAMPTHFANPVYGESYNTGVFGAYSTKETRFFLDQWHSKLIERQVDSNIENLWMRFSDQEALHAALAAIQFHCNFKFLNPEIWNATDVIWSHLLKANKFSDAKILHSKLTEFMLSDMPSALDVPADFLIDYPGYISE